MIQEGLDHNSWWVAMPPRGHTAQAETKPTQIQFLNDGCPLNSSTKWSTHVLGMMYFIPGATVKFSGIALIYWVLICSDLAADLGREQWPCLLFVTELWEAANSSLLPWIWLCALRACWDEGSYGLGIANTRWVGPCMCQGCMRQRNSDDNDNPNNNHQPGKTLFTIHLRN